MKYKNLMTAMVGFIVLAGTAQAKEPEITIEPLEDLTPAQAEVRAPWVEAARDVNSVVQKALAGDGLLQKCSFFGKTSAEILLNADKTLKISRKKIAQRQHMDEMDAFDYILAQECNLGIRRMGNDIGDVEMRRDYGQAVVALTNAKLKEENARHRASHRKHHKKVDPSAVAQNVDKAKAESDTGPEDMSALEYVKSFW